MQLLGELLLERSNLKVMVRYVADEGNLKLMMNLLRDSSRSIQFEAFHVFKVRYFRCLHATGCNSFLALPVQLEMVEMMYHLCKQTYPMGTNIGNIQIPMSKRKVWSHQLVLCLAEHVCAVRCLSFVSCYALFCM